MGILIMFSALFSGSEAAMFSLTKRNLKRLTRGGVGGRITAKMLRDPEHLLSAVLFWNLLINMTYFAIAAIVGTRLENNVDAGRTVAIAFTIVSLLSIIFFSEMLPKSVAVLAPLRISIMLGPPLSLAVRMVGPIVPLVTAVNQAASRLVWPSFKPEPEIDLADIERAINLGTDDAALLQRERMALQGLVEIAETRVGELMRPRNKLWMCFATVDAQHVLDAMPASGYLMLTDSTGDMITHSAGVRTLRPSQLDDLSSFFEPVIYVPWSALVSQVLDRLNEEHRSVAVVVNEFGELLGAVSIDAIMRNILAPRQQQDPLGEVVIQEVGENHFLVSGLVSVRALTKRLGIDATEDGVNTVAGYIQRNNERLPRVGDTARLAGFLLTVLEAEDNGIWIDIVEGEWEEDLP
ncbi:MAG: hemolysin activation protein [Rhodopirellula sp.]|nr:hemolysin activation protein [Rhodopirellula sp.]OUX51304.1 MAG: hemolysin activation protein [Rhodopirellula sp. TMED283]